MNKGIKKNTHKDSHHQILSIVILVSAGDRKQLHFPILCNDYCQQKVYKQET